MFRRSMISTITPNGILSWPWSQFLKVDFRTSDQELRREMARRYLPKGSQLVAEKVETQSEQDQARHAGYTCFQGYFFCQPTLVESRTAPSNKLNYARLLEAVNNEEFSFLCIPHRGRPRLNRPPYKKTAQRFSRCAGVIVLVL
jgi:c-di-GMP-related signal transduction protein